MVKLRGTFNDHEARQYVDHYVDLTGDSPERRALERLWFVNKAYFMGAQYIVLDDGRLRIPRRRGMNRELFQANKILPKVMKALAKILQTNADFVVAPKSGDFQDILAADTALKVWQYQKQVTKFRAKLRRAVLEAALCGTGWLQITFDDQIGTPNRLYTKNGKDSDLEPEFYPEVRQEYEKNGWYVDEYPGEVDISVPSAFSVYWDPNARAGGVPDCMWMAVVGYVPIEDLIDRFGDLGFQGDSYERGAALYEENIASLASGLQGYNGLGTFAKSQMGSRSRVIQFWERPAPRNDMKGRFIMSAGNTVIKNGGNPYAASGNPLPFVKIDWFPVEGRFTALSLVEQLRPSQKAYNRARSHSIEWQKTYGHAPVWLPKNSAVKAINLTSVPGQIYEYDSTHSIAPTFGTVPNLPPYIAENAKIASDEMDEISAQASPAKNAMPAGIRSGAAIQMVQADNNAMLTPIGHALLESIEEAGTMCLQLGGLHYDRPRVAQILGSGGVEVTKFVGADLRGHYELKLRAEPTPLESREAYKQTVMDAIAAKGLDPAGNPADRALFMSAMRFHTDQEILDVSTRQREDEHRIMHRLISDPAYIEKPRPFHDPEARLPVLEHFMNGPQFEGLSEEAKAKIFVRWQDFKNRMAEQVMQQLQAQQQMQGAPAEKGVASQPAMRG